MCASWRRPAGTEGRSSVPAASAGASRSSYIAHAAEPLGHDRVGHPELPPEIRGRQLAEHRRGAEIDPGVGRDLTALERGAVGAAVAEDLGALRPVAAVHDERAALAAGHVLDVVEGEAARVADAAERAPVESAY